MNSIPFSKIGLAVRAMLIGATALCASAAFAWEPTKTVEFVVPAGTGGGADQMARLVQGIVTKHNLMKSSMVVVNKGGGAGTEGFLEMKTPRAIRTRSSLLCPICSRRPLPQAYRLATKT